MSHKCVVSGKSRQNGHRVSHANNKTHRVFQSNLQAKKLYIPELKRSVRLKVSTRVLRTIDRIGLDGTLRKYNLTLADLVAK